MVHQQFQIVDHRAEQGGNFFPFVPGEKADVIIKMDVGPAEEDAAVSRGFLFQQGVQAHGQGVEGFRGAGHALDDDQRSGLGAGHKGLLEEVLPHVSGGDAIGPFLLVGQGDDLSAVKAAQLGFAVGLVRPQDDELIAQQGDGPPVSRRVHLI